MPLVQVKQSIVPKWFRCFFNHVHTELIFPMFRVPRVAAWGFTLGALGVFALERIPRLRKDVFSNLPVIGQYELWQKYKNFGY